jgi:ABC-type Mn2+/Zn2+ transport system permease subunit
MYLTMLIAGFVIACICPPIGCLIIAVDAYMVAAGSYAEWHILQ